MESIPKMNIADLLKGAVSEKPIGSSWHTKAIFINSFICIAYPTRDNGNYVNKVDQLSELSHCTEKHLDECIAMIQSGATADNIIKHINF
jgi:hypothetical protein